VPAWPAGILAVVVAATFAGAPTLARAQAREALPTCAEQPIAGDALAVVVEADRVSVDAQNVPVCALVSAISREAGLRLEGELTDERPVTLRVERQRLARMLDRLLGDGGYLLVLMEEPSGARGWIRLLGGSHSASSADSTATSDDAATPDATATVAPPSPDVSASSRRARRDAIELAGELDEAAALRVLSNALTDPDTALREAAVEELAAIDTASARELLYAALQDADVDVRLEVVDTLGDSDDARSAAALEQALADADARVREAAAEYLAERRTERTRSGRPD
jgi:hypothetical protein